MSVHFQITTVPIPNPAGPPYSAMDALGKTVAYAFASNGRVGLMESAMGSAVEYGLPVLNYRMPQTGQSGNSVAGVDVLAIARDGSVWIYSVAFGILRLVPAKGTLIQYKDYTASLTFSDVLTTDPKGRVWYAGVTWEGAFQRSATYSIRVLDPATNQVTSWNLPPGRGAPYCIRHFGDKNILVGLNSSAPGNYSGHRSCLAILNAASGEIVFSRIGNGPQSCSAAVFERGVLWFTYNDTSLVREDSKSALEFSNATAMPRALTVNNDLVWFGGASQVGTVMDGATGTPVVISKSRFTARPVVSTVQTRETDLKSWPQPLNRTETETTGLISDPFGVCNLPADSWITSVKSGGGGTLFCLDFAQACVRRLVSS